MIIDNYIIFKQISHFQKNNETNTINFNLIGFTFYNLKKNSYLYTPVNLIKNDQNNLQTIATCILNNDTNTSEIVLSPLTFDCKINDVGDINVVTDVEILSSPLIRNIPSGYSKIVYANLNDELINFPIVKNSNN